jgi:hypothetical protein
MGNRWLHPAPREQQDEYIPPYNPDAPTWAHIKQQISKPEPIQRKKVFRVAKSA